MSFWNQIYILIFLVGTASTLLLTPIAGILARKFDFMDRPQSNHKGHAKEVYAQ